MTSLSICKTQTNPTITANFLRFEPLTIERMSIVSQWIRASLLNTLLARHLELFLEECFPRSSTMRAFFMVFVVDRNAKDEVRVASTSFFAFPRLLVSCSRLHESPLQHCPCLLSIGSSAPVCLRALRVTFASSIRQCPCLGAIVSGTHKFDFALADPRTSATSSSTLGERPSARCPDRTTPIARNHVFTSCTDSTTLSWA